MSDTMITETIYIAKDRDVTPPPPTASFPRDRVRFPEHSIVAAMVVADTANVAPQHAPPTRLTYPPDGEEE